MGGTAEEAQSKHCRGAYLKPSVPAVRLYGMAAQGPLLTSDRQLPSVKPSTTLRQGRASSHRAYAQQATEISKLRVTLGRPATSIGRSLHQR